MPADVPHYQAPEEEKRRFAKRLVAFSDVVFGFALASIVFVVIGVAMLDCGLRATLVANQTSATNAAPEARSRATTIFTAHMWGGNAVGAMIASYAYAHWGWYAVCAIGVAASLTALMIARVTNRRHVGA